MSGTKKIFMAAIAVTTTGLIALILAGPSIQRSLFYPKPNDLPPVVEQSTEALLARVQFVLETNAPLVAAALQEGLTDTQIVYLEGKGEFRLSDDLRALYRWHNGIARSNTVGLVPGQRFVPLDEVVEERALIRQQANSATRVQQAAFAMFAGHRKNWVQILDDGAGDGYFFDPKRTEGSFFYHFAEAGYYVWFPSLRNFLSGVAECYESRSIKLAADGKSLDEDAGQTQKIWERLGKSSEGTR